MRTERQRRAVAYHEAGHAVMRLHLGRRLVRVTIKPKGDSLGHMLQPKTKIDIQWFGEDWRTRRWAETEIMVSMAGPEAEKRLTGRRNNAGAVSDGENVANVAMKAEGDGELATAFIRWLELKVAACLASPAVWVQVEAVAAALLERETLSGEEVRSTACRAFKERTRR